MFCPAPELPRHPGLLAPWAWEGRLGNGTRRGSHRGHSAEARSCDAAVRESRGSEASTRPVSGRDTAMDPGQGWTRGNRKWQRAPRVRRVAEKNTSKEPEPQKSSPGWLGVTPPEPRFLQRLGQHRYPPASRGLLCFQILHLKAESETPLSSRGGQALGSVGYLLPSLPRGWAQRGLRGQAAARSAPDASGSSVAAQPAPCESRPPPIPERKENWVVRDPGSGRWTRPRTTPLGSWP